MTDAGQTTGQTTGQMTAQVSEAYTAMAGRWDTAGAAWNQPVAERLVDLAGIAPPMRVLDVGCGAGAVSLRAARAVRPGGHVTGIDVAAPMLARARAEAAAAGLDNATFEQADAMAPPFGPGRFDAVLGSCVVYLLPDPAGAVARWLTLLRPGGVLGFTWVVAEDPAWEPVFDAVDAFMPDGQPGWNTYWRRWVSPAEAEAILAGYTAVHTVAEPVTTRYASPEHLWESCWTQAPRLVWQHIPAERRDAARDAAFALMDPIRAADGSYPRVRTTCYTTARA
jgi:ubiquinone/menaquinone biosynthesis C-methylase UbiE